MEEPINLLSTDKRQKILETHTNKWKQRIERRNSYDIVKKIIYGFGI